MSNRNRVDRVFYDPQGVKQNPSQGINAPLWNALVDLGVDFTGGRRPRRPNPFGPANLLPDLKTWLFDVFEEKKLKQVDKYDEGQDH